VRRRLHRFDEQGMEGLEDRAKYCRPRRLSAANDSKMIALVRKAPPGHRETQADGTLVARHEEGSAQWNLNALSQAAKEAGIQVKHSQIRTILRREGVRWPHIHRWSTPRERDFVPKERRSSPTARTLPKGRRPSAPTNSDQ
jgi:transposase